MSKKFKVYQGTFGSWVVESLPTHDGTYDSYNEGMLVASQKNLERVLAEGTADDLMGHAKITYRDFYESEIKRLTPK